MNSRHQYYQSDPFSSDSDIVVPTRGSSSNGKKLVKLDRSKLCVECRTEPRYLHSNGYLNVYCSRACASQVNLRETKQSHKRFLRTTSYRKKRGFWSLLRNFSRIFRFSKSTSPTPTLEDLTPRPKIFFHYIDQLYFELSNSSPYAVHYDGKRYPTAEHLFQCMKFLPYQPDIAEHIRIYSQHSDDAILEAAEYVDFERRDWNLVKVAKMEEVLYHKFTQHPSLQDMLASTRDIELIEDLPEDSFWGGGRDGRGRNEMGKALMRIRARLLSPYPY